METKSYKNENLFYFLSYAKTAEIKISNRSKSSALHVLKISSKILTHFSYVKRKFIFILVHSSHSYVNILVHIKDLRLETQKPKSSSGSIQKKKKKKPHTQNCTSLSLNK